MGCWCVCEGERRGGVGEGGGGVGVDRCLPRCVYVSVSHWAAFAKAVCSTTTPGPATNYPPYTHPVQDHEVYGCYPGAGGSGQVGSGPNPQAADESQSSERHAVSHNTRRMNLPCKATVAAPWGAHIQTKLGRHSSCMFSLPPLLVPTCYPPLPPAQEAKAAAELEVQPGLLELLAYLRDSQVCVRACACVLGWNGVRWGGVGWGSLQGARV